MTRLLPFTQPGEKAIQFDDGDDGGDGGEEGGDGGEGGCAAQHTWDRRVRERAEVRAVCGEPEMQRVERAPSSLAW